MVFVVVKLNNCTLSYSENEHEIKFQLMKKFSKEAGFKEAILLLLYFHSKLLILSSPLLQIHAKQSTSSCNTSYTTGESKNKVVIYDISVIVERLALLTMFLNFAQLIDCHGFPLDSFQKRFIKRHFQFWQAHYFKALKRKVVRFFYDFVPFILQIDLWFW